MKTAIAIRHVAFEDLGSFEAILSASGYRVCYRDVGKGELSEDEFVQTDLLIILGGPIGCYETDTYPFLKDEIELLTMRVRRNSPTIGICLGAQLIAAALGASVYRGPVKEIGWAPILITDEGMNSALKHLGHQKLVLHWHGDTFDLPSGARLLASTKHITNQAYAIGHNILGLQFHAEARVAGHEQWLIGHAVELATGHRDVTKLRDDMRRNGADLERRARMMFSDWLDGLQSV